MNLKLGDNFPRYPQLILDGKRVRGATGSFKVGFFNLAATYGQINRAVEGSVIEYFSEDSLATNVIPIDSNKYGYPYGRVDFGTFNRKIFTLRTAAEGTNYGFGISYLHSKDDETSIEFGSQPQENLVVGTDLRLAFDSRRIEFTVEGAASMYNSNISGGSFTDAQIDSLESSGYPDLADPSRLRSLNNHLSPFITVNQYLKPINPEELSSFAGEAAIKLNYYGNYFKASYIYRGGDFQSFGQSYLRTDVQGINILDRIKLFENKVFLSIGYENLNDNLNNTKTTTSGTTNFQTVNASISIYPRTNLPNITLGYTRYDNSNGKIDSLYGIDNGTNNLSASVYYNFIAGVEHRTNFNVTSSIKNDNSVYNNDANIVSAILGINSKWNEVLTSVVSIIYSNSEINSIEIVDGNSINTLTKFNYTTTTAGINVLLLDQLLDCTLTGGISFGDYERLAIDLYGNYKVLQNFFIGFQARYYRTENLSNNSIFGLTARYIL
jgi:hypothetical protein